MSYHHGISMKNYKTIRILFRFILLMNSFSLFAMQNSLKSDAISYECVVCINSHTFDSAQALFSHYSKKVRVNPPYKCIAKNCSPERHSKDYGWRTGLIQHLLRCSNVPVPEMLACKIKCKKEVKKAPIPSELAEAASFLDTLLQVTQQERKQEFPTQGCKRNRKSEIVLGFEMHDEDIVILNKTGIFQYNFWDNEWEVKEPEEIKFLCKIDHNQFPEEFHESTKLFSFMELYHHYGRNMNIIRGHCFDKTCKFYEEHILDIRRRRGLEHALQVHNAISAQAYRSLKNALGPGGKTRNKYKKSLENAKENSTY